MSIEQSGLPPGFAEPAIAPGDPWPDGGLAPRPAQVPAGPVWPLDGRQSPAAVAIARGAGRCLMSHGFAPAPEVTLATGRRADLIGISERGEIWIVEIKSSLADFRADSKWAEYMQDCDRLFFAVAPDFPREHLPTETGLIIADPWHGEVVRPAPLVAIPAARRKGVLIRVARATAFRLAGGVPREGW